MITFQLVIFLLGLVFLIKFTKEDLKTSEVENKPILAFLLIGLLFAFIFHQLIAILAVMVLLGIVGYVLWRKKAIGGADVKILFCLPAYFATNGFPETIVTTWFFLMLFLVVGVVYSVVAKKVFKKEEVPFLPAITITYVLIVLWKLYSNL